MSALSLLLRLHLRLRRRPGLGLGLGQRLACAIAALLLAAGAHAAPPYETPPLPGPPRPLNVAAPQQQTLGNGLRVVVAERRGLPLVTAQLLVLAGAETDPPRAPGLAALTAGLLTRGTRKLSAPAQASAAEALGGTLDSGAGWHQTSVAMTVTTPRLDAALALIAAAVIEPAFAAAELERLRAERIDELQVAYASPGSLATRAALQMLFGDGAYGHAAEGTPAALAAITRNEVLALHAAQYRPGNAVLVLAGDIDLAAAVKLAERHFGRWNPPATKPPLPALTGEPSRAPLSLIDIGAGSGQAAVVVVLPVPARGGADDAVGAVANAVLGGGYSSRLNQEIRIKRGLSYGAGSAFDARRGGGLLRAAVQTKNESAAEVLALVQAQVDSLMQAPVPDAELAARKATLIGSFSRSVETGAGLATQVGALLAAGLAPDELRGRIAALSAVDAVAVQRYAKQYFGAERRRAAVAGDAGQIEPSLRKMESGLVKMSPADLGAAP